MQLKFEIKNKLTFNTILFSIRTNGEDAYLYIQHLFTGRSRSITTGKPNSAAMDGEIYTKTTVHFNNIRIKSERNVYEMSTERSLTETESSEQYPDNQSSHESGDYKFDVEFRHTDKSFQNLNVQIKEEPNAYDIRNSYSSNETETRDKLIDNQGGNSGDKDEHVRMSTSGLDRYGTNYAVCIKFEPNSCEVRNSCMKSEKDVDIGKTNDIDGTPDNSHCYENDSHDSNDILNIDVQHTCRPIESEIDGSNFKETNTEQNAPCDNIDNSEEQARHKDKRRKITYTCDICSYSTVWPDHFLKHKRKHTQEYPYTCDVCSYSAAKSSHLDAHKRKHAEKPYKCEKCSYSTDMSDRLEAHKRKHAEKPYTCGVCSYSTDMSDRLEAHKRKHAGEKPYKCDVCSFKANWPSVLERHKRKHTGEKPYKCDVCSYCTSTVNGMWSHKQKHTGEFPYKCDVCSFKANWPSVLERHKRKHTRKPYKCDVCSYCTASSNILEAHKQKHIGEIPYKCDVCSYSAKWSSDLARHKRTHVDKKPFKCSYTTVSSKTLDKHEIKHIEEERSRTSATSHTEEERSRTSATSRRLRTILPKPQNFDLEKIDIEVRNIPVLFPL